MHSRNPFSFFLLASLAATLFLGILFWQPQSSAAAGETAVVTSNIVNIRSGPGTNYGITSQVGLYERLPILASSGDWYKVQLASGGSGWLAGWLAKVEKSQTPAQAQQAGQVAVIKGSYINVRSGPGTGYGIVTQVGQNERFPVLEKSGDWYKVQLKSGSAGWLAGWLVNLEAAASPTPSPAIPPPANSAGSQVTGKTAVVTGSTLNVRSGPGTSNGVVDSVSRGDNLSILEQSGDWYRVKLPNGFTGWVAGWLVSVMASPVVQPQTPNPVPPSGNPIPPASNPTPPPSSPPASSGGTGTDGKEVRVTGGGIVVLGAPGAYDKIVGQATRGDILPVLEQRDNWYKVKLSNGTAGWVGGWLVSEDLDPPAPPEDEVSRGGGDRPSANQTGRALSLKVTEKNGETTIAIEVNAPFEYTQFFLSSPDRLVVDLKGVAVGDLPVNKKVGSKTMNQVRTGQFQKNPYVTRLVFELNGGAQYVSSLSKDRKTLLVQTYIPNISGSYKNRVIAIDAGHGGPDPGASGALGTREKDVTLDIANRVKKLLEARGAKVIMTRSGDQDVGLYERTDIANNARTDIFVSIHINAHPDKGFGGTSTYIHNGSAGQTRIQESEKLAYCVQNELLKALGLRDVGVRRDNFAVLRTSEMPAILAELAFISNVTEEKLMNTDEFRNKSAEAIVRGIGLYFSERKTVVNY